MFAARHSHLIRICLLALVLIPRRSSGFIEGEDGILIDFSTARSEVRARWSEGIRRSDSGLHVQPGDVAREITLLPFPVGRAWRPPVAAQIRLICCFDRLPPGGAIVVEVRYGCDKVHWSDWSGLEPSPTHAESELVTFEGDLEVSAVKLKEFNAHHTEWLERAECPDRGGDYIMWMHDRHPEISERIVPAIGWIQVRIRVKPEAVQPISVHAVQLNAFWGISGLLTLNADGEECIGVDARETPWHFDASRANGGQPIRFEPGETDIRSGWRDEEGKWVIQPTILKLCTRAAP